MLTLLKSKVGQAAILVLAALLAVFLVVTAVRSWQHDIAADAIAAEQGRRMVETQKAMEELRKSLKEISDSTTKAADAVDAQTDAFDKHTQTIVDKIRHQRITVDGPKGCMLTDAAAQDWNATVRLLPTWK